MSIRERLRVKDSDDAGFTLIEVIVAFVLIGILAVSTLSFAIQSRAASSFDQHSRVAVALSNGVMEQLNAVPSTVNTVTSVTNLVTGRRATTVASAWSANATVDGVAATYQLSDPTATGASIPALPVSSQLTSNGTIYTTYLMIGTCYRKLATGSDGSCGLAPGYSSTSVAPATTPSGYAPELRAIAVTTWSSDDLCPTGCEFHTSTLIDPSGDLQWVTS